jgi:hypothetical protein
MVRPRCWMHFISFYFFPSHKRILTLNCAGIGIEVFSFFFCFFSLPTLCYASLQLSRWFLHWNWRIRGYSYLPCINVLRFYSVLQVVVGSPCWNCYIKSELWMLGRDILIFQGHGSVAEKCCRACATGAGVVALSSNLRSALALEFGVSTWFLLFFLDAVLCLLAAVEMLCALDSLHQG